MSRPAAVNGMRNYSVSDLVINRINKRFFLADFQREYQWDEENVCNLFDSIFKGYPIGICLVWKQNISEYQASNSHLYSFVRVAKKDKNVGDRLDKNTLENIKEIYSVLDGQQRMTALYLGLTGGYQRWRGSGRRSKKQDPPFRQLYFSPKVHAKSSTGGEEEEFKFFTLEEVGKESKKWLLVNEIVRQKKIEKLEKYCETEQLKKHERKSVIQLFNKLVNENVIQVFEVNKSFSSEDVLNIFLRFNAGGKPLKRTDLLFAIAINEWHEGRDEIDELIDQINHSTKTIGSWDIDRDFILRGCLYLSDQYTSLRADDLQKVDFGLISQKWSDIEKSIIDCLQLLCEKGHSSDSILSTNAIMPILYYMYHNPNKWDSCKEELNKLFIISQLNGWFSSSTDTVLLNIHKVLQSYNGKPFVWKDFANEIQQQKMNYDCNCDANRISSWVIGDSNDDPYQKGRETMFILSALPQYYNTGNAYYEQDHLHPYSSFDDQAVRNKLLQQGVTQDDLNKFIEHRNDLGNLWLLKDRSNRRKLKKPLADWIATANIPIAYDPKDEITSDSRFTQGENPYDMKYFLLFWEKRSELIINELKTMLL